MRRREYNFYNHEDGKDISFTASTTSFDTGSIPLKDERRRVKYPASLASLV